MFAARYFPARYFASRYFPEVGAGSIPLVKPTLALTGSADGISVAITTAESGVTSFDIDHNGTVLSSVSSPQDYVIANYATAHKWRGRSNNIFGHGPWSDYPNLGHGTTVN